MQLVDLYALHEQKAKNGRLTIHPSRWLHAGRQFGQVFDFLSDEEQIVQVGGRAVSHFKGLSTVGLHGKVRQRHSYYLASETVATRYEAYVPRGSTLECAVRDMLAMNDPQSLIEVNTPVGSVDLVCPDAIVEVKRLSKWKQALGQVLAYSVHYPRRRRIIHLFGQVADPSLRPHVQVCQSFGVTVQYQQLLPSSYGPASLIGPTVTVNPSIERTCPGKPGHASMSKVDHEGS